MMRLGRERARGAVSVADVGRGPTTRAIRTPRCRATSSPRSPTSSRPSSCAATFVRDRRRRRAVRLHLRARARPHPVHRPGSRPRRRRSPDGVGATRRSRSCTCASSSASARASPRSSRSRSPRSSATATAGSIRESPRAGVYDAPLLTRMQKLVAILPAYDLLHVDFGEIAHAPPGFHAGAWTRPVRRRALDRELPVLSAADDDDHDELHR